MNLNQVTVPCLDLGQSVDFYRRLGLQLIVYDPPRYARFQCPSGDSTFSLHRADHADSASAPVIYFEVEDLDEHVRQLQDAGLRFESGQVDQPWLWREAFICDPAGNRLCLYRAGSNRLFPPWRLSE